MPRIYVACLASYNSGTLHGEWIDCDGCDEDELQDAINAMLRKSPYPNVTVEDPETGEMVPSAEEWAVHDYEGFGSWKLGEYPSLSVIAAYCRIISDLSDTEAEGFQAWVDNQNESDIDWDSAIESFRDQYRGCWDSLADYVEDYWEQCGEYKRDDKNWWSPINYVDWERMGRDLDHSGDIWTHDGDNGIHVFDNH